MCDSVIARSSRRRAVPPGRLAAIALLIAMLLGTARSHADPPAADRDSTSRESVPPGAGAAGVSGKLADITGPRVETTVVALTLNGVGSLDNLSIPDLDILEGKDGVRLLPLLRILRILDVEVSDTASVLTFSPDKAPLVKLDYAAGIVSVGGSPSSIQMVAGVSDITDQAELYVQESAVAAMLSMEVTWDPRLYEYGMRSNRPLEVFKRRRESSALLRRSALAGYDLPGHLPPARPRRSLLPTPQFTEVQLLSDLTARGGEPGVTGSFPPPQVTLWADVLRGNLTTRVSPSVSQHANGYQVDRLSWSAGFDESALSVGSVNLGLSELVFPSLSLIGAMANGRKGVRLQNDYQDPSQLGSQETFLPVYVFDGHAPLGSEVTLSINGQDVETRKVEPGPGGPPGEGPYRFEGVNLFTSNLNDVRIRVAAPDGSVEETRRRVLGTNLLMSPGDLAFIGGFGGRRQPSSDALTAEGRFGGGRLNLGIAEGLSMGMSAAYQDGLYDRNSFVTLGSDAPLQPPSRSIHLGSRLAWQPLDPLLVSAEAARSQGLPDSAANCAIRTDAEYQFGELHLHPSAFRYGPAFFDGQDPELSDLTGASMGLYWRYGSGNQITLGGSRMRDDLDGRRAQALRSHEVQASWSVHGVVPRSTLTLGARRIWVADAPELRTWLLGLEGSLPWGWDLYGHSEFGDDIRRKLGERLPGGSTWRFDYSSRVSSAPDGGLGIGVSSQTSTLEMRRRFGDAWQVSLAHRAAGTFRRSTVDLSRLAAGSDSWQARLSPGYDWDSRSLYLQNRFELFVGRSRANRLVLENQLLRHEWFVRLSVQIQTDVGIASGRPVPLLDSRVDPGDGGVKGRVFLDLNGNGLPDRGEPGLKGIEVTTEQGRKAVSCDRGLFVIPNLSSLRRTRVSLEPEMLGANYTMTQATQEAILRPGDFTEVNLGVAALGSISGTVLVLSTPGDSSRGTREAVPGVRVVLFDQAGKEADNSITGRDGVFTIDGIKPGHYIVRVDDNTLPDDFVLETRELPVEVKSQEEPFEKTGLVFAGRYTNPRETADQTENDKKVEYKVFSRSAAPTSVPRASILSASRPERIPGGRSTPGAAQPRSKSTIESTLTPAPTTTPSATLTPAPTTTPSATLAPAPTTTASATLTPAPTTTPRPAPTLTPAPTTTPRPTPTLTPAPTTTLRPAPTTTLRPTPTTTLRPTPTLTPAPTPMPARGETIAVVMPQAPDAGLRGGLRVAYGRTLPEPQPRAPEGTTCDCRVEGTVEVNSEKPLSSAMMVVVSLADAPACRDTVELFMGSPRPFDLGRVPCGMHKLDIRPLSPRHFAVVSPVPAAFDCSAERVRQCRVVLEPR